MYDKQYTVKRLDKIMHTSATADLAYTTHILLV